MGLDQWVYRVRKCSDAELKEVKEKGVNDVEGVIGIPEAEIDDYLIGDWDGLYDIVACPVRVTDWDKMFSDLSVPEGYVQCGSSWSGGNIVFTFRKKDDIGAELYKLECSADEIDRRWTHDAQEKFAVFHAEEVQYWRKWWDMQEEVIEGHIRVENCGYHILTHECLAEMHEYSLEGEDSDWREEFRPPMLFEGEALAYHPWW